MKLLALFCLTFAVVREFTNFESLKCHLALKTLEIWKEFHEINFQVNCSKTSHGSTTPNPKEISTTEETDYFDDVEDLSANVTISAETSKEKIQQASKPSGNLTENSSEELTELRPEQNVTTQRDVKNENKSSSTCIVSSALLILLLVCSALFV